MKLRRGTPSAAPSTRARECIANWGAPTSTVGMPVRAGCHRSDRRPAGQVGAVLVALQRYTGLAARQFEGGGRPAVGGVPQVGLHLQHRTAVDGDPVRRFMPFRVVRVGGVRRPRIPPWKSSTAAGSLRGHRWRPPRSAQRGQQKIDWYCGRRSSRPPRDRTAPAPGETHPLRGKETPQARVTRALVIEPRRADKVRRQRRSARTGTGRGSSGRPPTDQTVGSRRGRRHSRN